MRGYGLCAAGGEAVITFDRVTKIYRPLFKRPVVAVKDFTLEISPGEILGLAGPNGAGKSTLIGLILGYHRPTAGRVSIRGSLPREYVQRNGIGYLSELVAIPPAWTLRGALMRYALLSGLGDREAKRRVDDVIERLALVEHRDKRVKELSKGTEQRLGLAQAILRDEAILILDEPTHGLDPVWTQRFRELVRELRAPHRVMLIASHNLDELERVADRVAIIDRGSLRRMVDLRSMNGDGASLAYRILVAEGEQIVASVFPAALQVAPHEFETRVASVRALNEGLAALIARGAAVRGVSPAYSSLERQFRDVVGEEVA